MTFNLIFCSRLIFLILTWNEDGEKHNILWHTYLKLWLYDILTTYLKEKCFQYCYVDLTYSCFIKYRYKLEVRDRVGGRRTVWGQGVTPPPMPGPDSRLLSPVLPTSQTSSEPEPHCRASEYWQTLPLLSTPRVINGDLDFKHPLETIEMSRTHIWNWCSLSSIFAEIPETVNCKCYCNAYEARPEHLDVYGVMEEIFCINRLP